MSLKPSAIEPVPEKTARIAKAAFRKGNPYLSLRDELGPIFADTDFVDLFPRRGQPGLPPWRLALVTLLQFRENLPDRQAAEAVRARIDWKYLLGLELADSGFDRSVLSEFRARLLDGGAEERLLHKLLEVCQARGLLKARGRQRTDATHVLASIRVLNRLELLGETLRAALNELATVAPGWLREVAPEDWSKRYARRIEDGRLPRAAVERDAYVRTVGADGFALLDRLDRPETAAELRQLPKVAVLRQVWQRHFTRDTAPPPRGGVRLKAKGDPQEAAEPIESPYDPQARYRSRSGVGWTGYVIHLTETCEDDTVHLLTHVMTTTAAVHEAKCIEAIHQALADKGLTPGEHLVDAAYIDAAMLVRGQETLAIELVGPPRPSSAWQARVEGGYGIDHFEIDWEHERARCPQGKPSSTWSPRVDRAGAPYILVSFAKLDCARCPARPLCTRAKHQARRLRLHRRAEHEALKAARERLTTKEGRRRYARRAGIEGTLSQGVRAFGLRRSRYRGLARTHLQHVATAAAINLGRLAAWFRACPRAATRTSRFAALAA
ncbi:MAG TPA: IS1182 family transposase [Geminicoccaceae bacterium]|nr:IS1182 family transposase [Geminicoccaceae bacterium]